MIRDGKVIWVVHRHKNTNKGVKFDITTFAEGTNLKTTLKNHIVLGVFDNPNTAYDAMREKYLEERMDNTIKRVFEFMEPISWVAYFGVDERGHIIAVPTSKIPEMKAILEHKNNHIIGEYNYKCDAEDAILEFEADL